MNDFYKLPSNSREILKLILNEENPEDVLCKKFESATPKEDIELRSILGELEEQGLVYINWADDVPYIISIKNPGRTYFERESEYIKMQEKSNTQININATGSNFIVGNVANSNINIDNSVHEIERRIETEGEEDKEQLREILEETKELLENIKESRHIPKDKGFIKRLTSHLDKHGWFYAEIVSLLGNTAIKLLGGN